MIGPVLSDLTPFDIIAAERDRLVVVNDDLLAIIRAAEQLRTVLGTTVADWAAWDKVADAVLAAARKPVAQEPAP